MEDAAKLGRGVSEGHCSLCDVTTDLLFPQVLAQTPAF